MFYVTRRLKPILNNSKRMLVSSGQVSTFNFHTNLSAYGLKNSVKLNPSSFRLFSSKDDKPEKTKDPEEKEEEKEETGDLNDAVDTSNNKSIWFNTKQRLASKLLKQTSAAEGEEQEPPVENEEQPPLEEVEQMEEAEEFEGKPVHKLYVIKFNSPILPFSKFPLTQNKYIQQFFKKYSRDREGVDRLIGVHFQLNKNSNAKDSIGIEIELDRSSSNMNVVESKNFKRFKVIDFNESTNFCKAVEFEDRVYKVRNAEGERIDLQLPDILASED